MKVHCFEIPTCCSASRSPRIPESAVFLDFRALFLRIGVPELLKSIFLTFPTSCSAHRSPRIPERSFLMNKFSPPATKLSGTSGLFKRSPMFEKKFCPSKEAARDKWFLPKKVNLTEKEVLPQAAKLPGTSGFF